MITALLALALAAGDARSPATQKVAVWSIHAAQGVNAGAMPVLEDVIATELAKTGRFQVIAKSDLAALLGYEKQRAAMGCTESACLAQLGGAVGADLVLSGQAGQLGSQWRLSLLLVDTKKGVAVARVARFTAPTEDALAEAVPGLVSELVGAAPQPGLKEAPLTSAALLDRASALAKQGRHADAAAEYDSYPSKFPEGKDRCLAGFRAALEWEAAGKASAAAERYLKVGSDEFCQQAGPNAAGQALAKAATMLDGAGLGAEAKKAYQRLVALKGVTDPGVQSKIEAAKMRLQMDESQQLAPQLGR